LRKKSRFVRHVDANCTKKTNPTQQIRSCSRTQCGGGTGSSSNVHSSTSFVCRQPSFRSGKDLCKLKSPWSPVPLAWRVATAKSWTIPRRAPHVLALPHRRGGPRVHPYPCRLAPATALITSRGPSMTADPAVTPVPRVIRTQSKRSSQGQGKASGQRNSSSSSSRRPAADPC
jgi:hypothetical protein